MRDDRERKPSTGGHRAVRVVVLGGGRSQRMGFDKLAAVFAGEPLARRVARALAPLRPLVVTTRAVAAAIGAVDGVDVLVTPATAGPAETLRLADAAIAHDAYLAVVPCDVPFLDAARVRDLITRVPDDADLAWPVVDGVPGHPVVWSPRARTRIAALPDDVPPMRVRDDAQLRTSPIAADDDAYVIDVDTPEAWARALRRAEAQA